MSKLQVPRKQIVSTLFDDGDGVLVDLNTKRYYQLNETAMVVWSGLEKGQDVTGIVDEIRSNFTVTADHAAESVKRILQDFEANNLLGTES